MIPKRTSRCLAVVQGVGDTDEIVERTTTYFRTVFDFEVASIAALRTVIPNFQPKYFDTEDDMFEYIAAKDYNTDLRTPGICMGF